MLSDNKQVGGTVSSPKNSIAHYSRTGVYDGLEPPVPYSIEVKRQRALSVGLDSLNSISKCFVHFIYFQSPERQKMLAFVG